MASQRSEIKEEYKWDIESLYTTEKVEKEIKNVKTKVKQLGEFQNKLDDSEKLLEFLELYSNCSRKVNKLHRYASMKSDQDTRDQDARGLKNRISSLNTGLKEQTSFKDIEIQQIGLDRLEEMKEEEKGLEKYDFYLEEILRMKPYTLSHEVEKTISTLSEVLDSPSETYKVLSNADIRYPEVERDGEKVRITDANFGKLLRDRNRDFRKRVYDGYYTTLSNFKNTIGVTLSKSIRTNVKLAEIKGFDSARHASLYTSNISLDVYDNLIETVEDNLEPLHKHMELKAKTQDTELHMHDINVPIPESESPEINYEKAQEHVINALEPLGEEYQSKVREAFENRWIDVYETEGKRSGAYSGGSYDTKPYILMNYQDDIDSMYTLAHELGHSMHSYLTQRNQPYLHSHYGIFVAEVASNVNEALLTKYLLENIEDQEIRLHILSHVLQKFRGSLYRQTLFADFEKQIYQRTEEDKPVTPDEASKIYSSLKSRYYKPVQMDEHIELEWMRIPHFYYNFYVYQYATGISAAQKLSEQIINSGPDSYLDFLKKGGSDHPLKLLNNAGVDMSSAEPVKDAVSTYSSYVDKMEKMV